MSSLLPLELIRRSQHNNFDGEQVFADLLAHRADWQAVLFDTYALVGGSGLSGLIKLRDMQEETPAWMQGLSERQIKAMEYVSQHGRVTNREYQELCGVSRSTAKKELQALVMRGLLQQQGTGRYAHYVLAGIGHTQ